MDQKPREQTDITEATAGHALNPRNYGRLSRYDGWARITGPCGDTMEFWIQVKEDRVERCTFITDGCGPSLASGSVATELAIGRAIVEVAAIGRQDILSALGGLPTEVKHCALLAADTLRSACRDFIQRDREAATPDNHAAGNESCESCPNTQCQTGDRHQGESQAECADRQKLLSRMSRIGHKILVLSGKGGVGEEHGGGESGLLADAGGKTGGHFGC